MAFLVAVLALGGGCKSEGKKTPAKPPAQRAEKKKITPVVVANPVRHELPLFEKFQCNRCHHGLDLPAPPEEKQCVGCHQQILFETYDAPQTDLVRWRSSVEALPAAPLLSSIGQKLSRSWVKQQLLAPIDVRPGMRATMPRLRISPEDADALAKALVPEEVEDVVFPKEGMEAGKRLFFRHGCNGCHSFEEPSGTAVPLAPHLGLTRVRFQSGRLVPWLMDPQKIQPGALMPNFGLSKEEATNLAAYLWFTPVDVPKATMPERLPVLQREVSFEEVSENVFRKRCWHCHAKEVPNQGDTRVGLSGGFGFLAKQLDLTSVEAIQKGSLGENKERRNVLVPDESGEAPLVRVLWLRHQESTGDFGDIRGMPLGFPALSSEEIQLVESWVSQVSAGTD